MKFRLELTIALFALLLSVLVVSPVAAQDDAPPPDEPGQERGDGQDERQSLDDLLGLEEDESLRRAREAAEEEAAKELEEALTEQQVSDAFKEAIRQMALSASMLGEEFDTGLGTQRVQEEILEKLDILIRSARQMQSQSSSSSSSSSQQQQQQQQQQQARRQQQNQQQTGQQQNQSQTPATTGGVQPPPAEQGDISSILEEAGEEWGQLPPRIREQLLQGRHDKPSSLYRRLTEEYYRRLAEESSG